MAEAAAVDYLERRGLHVVVRNWRTRWHEVDIVARSAGGLHFIEVKYRKTAYFGSGFDAISADKAQRLRRAALNWIQQHHYAGSYQIDIVSLIGPPGKLDIEYLPNAVQDF